MKKKEHSTLSIFLLIILSAFIFSFGYKIVHPMDYHRIKVEVLNGCGVQNLANETARFLRKKGFDVTFYGNAAEPQKKTVMVDKLSPDKKWAKIVKSVLGMSRISAQVDSARCINVLVILGMDYNEVLPKEILNGRLIGIK